MPIYQVSYDLHPPNQDYPRIEEALRESRGANHVLGSTWLIWTPENVTAFRSRLLKSINRQDRLLITRVTSEYSGWMSPKVWEWIQARLAVDAKAARRFKGLA